MRTNKVDNSSKKIESQVILKKMLEMKKTWLESSCDTDSVKALENRGYTFAKFK